MMIFTYILPIFILIIFSCFISIIHSGALEHVGDDFPTPHSNHSRVLAMILAFDLNHFDPLKLIFNEYLTMCEAGWDPTIVVFTAVNWDPILRRYVRRHMYCYRLDKYVEVKVLQYDRSIGIGLGAQHRKYTGQEINNYDVFIYHEDDILFQYTHLVAYLHETKKLHQLDPMWGLNNNCIGFQRYRHIIFSPGYITKDIIEQNLLEEMPNFDPICFENTNEPYIKVTSNVHQAIWILTKNQILLFQEKCQFLNYSTPSREHMSSFGLFSHCKVTKLIPAKAFTTFTILHYYPQKHVSWTPVFSAVENIETGYHYYAVPKVKMNTPACWTNITIKAIADMENDKDLNTTIIKVE